MFKTFLRTVELKAHDGLSEDNRVSYKIVKNLNDFDHLTLGS